MIQRHPIAFAPKRFIAKKKRNTDWLWRGTDTAGTVDPTIAKVGRTSQGLSILGQYLFQIKILIIAVATLVVFYQDLYLIGSDALASDYFNYVLILPLFSALLIWRKRRVLAAVMNESEDQTRKITNSIVGTSALLVSLIIYLYGTYTTFPLDFHLIAFQIFLGACILILFNRKTLWLLLVPILFTSSALPFAVQFGLNFWIAMSFFSVFPALSFLSAIGLHVSFIASTNAPGIELTAANGAVYPFIVGAASSGIYSVIGFTVFAFFIAYVSRGALWKKIVLFVLAYPLLLLINVVREIILVVVANYYGIIAFDIFHLTSGIVLVFLATFFLLMIGDRFFKLRYLTPSGKSRWCPYCSGEFSLNHAFCMNCGRYLRKQSGFVKITSKELLPVISIATILIIFIFSLAPAVVAVTAPTGYNLNTLTEQQALQFMPNIPHWNLQFVDRDTFVQEAISADAVLIYQYVSNNLPSNVSVQATLIISPTIHTPEASLITYPSIFGHSQAIVYEDHDVTIFDNPPLVGRFLAYEQYGLTFSETILYWQGRAEFNYGSFSDVRNVQIQLYALPGDLASSGLISNPNNYTQTQDFLLPLARLIASYWTPLSSNSLIQGAVQKYSASFLTLAIAPSVVVAGREVIVRTREEKTNQIIFERLGNQREKSLIQAIRASKKQRKSLLAHDGATLEQAIQNFRRLTGEEIKNPADAYRSLSYAERVGLVRQSIVDRSSEPILEWKSRMPVSLESEEKSSFRQEASLDRVAAS